MKTIINWRDITKEKIKPSAIGRTDVLLLWEDGDIEFYTYHSGIRPSEFEEVIEDIVGFAYMRDLELIK